LLLVFGCGDDDAMCGNLLDAGTTGVTITVLAQTFTFGDFHASMANDCGAESVSIEGFQLDPTPASTFRLSLCVPDRGAVGAAPIALTSVMNFFAAAQNPTDSCAYTYDQAQTPTGTVTFAGFCAAGEAPFSIAFDATLPVTSTCAGATMTLGGSASVEGF
jgi:hypothetical protein